MPKNLSFLVAFLLAGCSGCGGCGGIAPGVPNTTQTRHEEMADKLASAKEPLAPKQDPKAGTNEVALFVMKCTEALRAVEAPKRTAAARALGAFGKEVQSEVLIVFCREELKIAVQALAEALNDDSVEVRGAAAAALRELGPDAKETIPALVGVLKNKDEEIIGLAAQALQTMGPDAAKGLPVFRDLFLGNDGPPHHEIAHLLDKIGPASIPVLIEGLEHPNKAVRNWALWFLARKGVREGLTALAKYASGPDHDWRMIAVQIAEQAAPHSKVVAPNLVECLQDKDPHLRLLTLKAIKALGPDAKDAVPALIQEVRKKNGELHWPIALETLSKVGPGGAEAIPLLVELLEDSNGMVRSRATKGLGAMGPTAKSAVPDLCRVIKSKDRRRAYDAIEALGNIGSGAKAAVPLLVDLLNQPNDLDLDYWLATVRALAQIGDAETVLPILKPLLKSRKGDPFFVAKLILQMENDPEAIACAVDTLWSATEFDRPAEAILLKVGAPAIPILVEKLNAELPADKSEIELYQFRCNIIQTLGKLGPKAEAAVLELQKILELCKTGQERHVGIRIPVAKALWDISKDKNTISFFTELLADPNTDRVGVAAHALGQIGPDAKSAIPALVKLVTHRVYFVRRSVADAIKSIEPEMARKLGLH